MASEASDKLSYRDKRLIQGFRDPERPEPYQLDLPYWAPKTVEEQKESSQQRLGRIKDKAKEVIKRVDEAKEKIDTRCVHLSVDSEGSRIFQAMVRVFDERTTTVMYDHYKKALEMRKELAKEDTEYLRKI